MAATQGTKSERSSEREAGGEETDEAPQWRGNLQLLAPGTAATAVAEQRAACSGRVGGKQRAEAGAEAGMSLCKAGRHGKLSRPPR